MNYQSVDTTIAANFLPMVSVVVPIYNAEIDVPALIDCLSAQTYPKDRVEYLLVDNNSSDRTLALLQAVAVNSAITIRVLSENQIQSSYAARNTGIRAATGEIIAFTDADCHPQPQWLESLIQPFVNLEVVIVAGEITALPGKTLLEKYAERQETLSQKHTLAHPFCPYGQTANLAIRRTALEEVGLFRPYLTTGGDADMCWRILQQNLGSLEFAAKATVQHRHRSTLKEFASQWRRYGRSNRYLHELYGVELMPEMTLLQYSHRLARWVLKEVPKNMVKAIAGQATVVDLFNTPITVFLIQARIAGQKNAKLPDNAKDIAWL